MTRNEFEARAAIEYYARDLMRPALAPRTYNQAETSARQAWAFASLLFEAAPKVVKADMGEKQ